MHLVNVLCTCIYEVEIKAAGQVSRHMSAVSLALEATVPADSIAKVQAESDYTITFLLEKCELPSIFSLLHPNNTSATALA